jgi:hypothetical protein
MREVVLFVCVLSSAAAAESLQAGFSLDAGPAVGLDGRFGGAVSGRVLAERRVADRVSIGAGVDASFAYWHDVGDVMSEDLRGVQLFGQGHVAIRLGSKLRLEPAVAFGAMHFSGERMSGWLPAYSSTIAVVHGNLRAGVRSRIAIGDLDGFSPDTELGLFFGVQR